MASTYSSDLKLELMATGENAGTWGNKTNTNLNLIQQAIGGYQSIDVTSADVDLDMNNGAISNARNMVVRFSSTGSGLSAARTVTVPNSLEKFYLFVDDTTHDGNTLTVKMNNGTSSGFTCVQGKSHFAYANGSEINLVSGSQLANLTLNDILTNGNSSTGTINVSNITVSAATTCNTIVASSTVSAIDNITTTAGNVVDQKGEMRLVPVESKSTNYTLQASDHGKVISISAGDITVPSGVFSAGQTVTIFSNRSSGVTDINRSGVTMYWATDGSNANRDLEPRGVATILCVASNTFVITGGTLS
jgi:hypothetical protein